MSGVRAFLPLFLFAVLLAWLGVALTKGDPRTLTSNLIDEPFPAFELSSLDDPAEILSEAILEDQISLVNVFGSWCTACVQEHPNLMEIAKMERVNLIGLNWRDTRAKGRAWLDKYRDPYVQVIFDADSELAIALGVTGAPETYVVDKSGNIRYKHVGIITGDVWRRDLEPLISKLETGE